LNKTIRRNGFSEQGYNMPREMKPNVLIDTLIDMTQQKNGRALAAYLGVLPSTITKIRQGDQQVTAEIMIKIHERTGMSIARIKQLAGQV
jgi:plasmid maintenance system antidote protein VapI